MKKKAANTIWLHYRLESDLSGEKSSRLSRACYCAQEAWEAIEEIRQAHTGTATDLEVVDFYGHAVSQAMQSRMMFEAMDNAIEDRHRLGKDPWHSDPSLGTRWAICLGLAAHRALTRHHRDKALVEAGACESNTETHSGPPVANSRFCKCGLNESDSAWDLGDRACPVCRAVWPENLKAERPDHQITFCPTTRRGCDSGRIRYRVECSTCNVCIHSGTTGPGHMAQGHLQGRKGYEEPL